MDYIEKLVMLATRKIDKRRTYRNKQRLLKSRRQLRRPRVPKSSVNTDEEGLNLDGRTVTSVGGAEGLSVCQKSIRSSALQNGKRRMRPRLRKLKAPLTDVFIDLRRTACSSSRRSAPDLHEKPYWW